MLLLAAVLWSLTGPGSCRLEAGGPAPTRIELYTSEGCSSCPPADRWLASLPDQPGMLILALHVDYWDDLGWPDRFARAEFGLRQRQLVSREGGRVSYTPAVFREGRSWRGWTRGDDPALPPEQPGPLLVVDVSHPAPRRLRLQIGAIESEAIQAAVIESGLSTRVRAGENRGHVLRHDHVVRAWAGAVPSERPIELDVPADLDRVRSRLLVWAEDREGRTLQGLAVPYPDCDR